MRRCFIPITPRKLIKHMVSLSDPSNPDEDGMCYGVAYMAIPDILTDQLDKFDQRLEQLDKIPVGELAAHIDLMLLYKNKRNWFFHSVKYSDKNYYKKNFQIGS
jgi:hypothetical protein